VTGPYQFRPFTADDLPLMASWLRRPHLTEWWGDPDEQLAVLRDDLDHPAMDQYLVWLDDRPIAYLQCYHLTAWNDGFGPQPDGTRGIDQSIGDAGLLGRGHGSAFIRQFTDALLASGTPRIVTDPSPDNPRAIRCYEKAGFSRDRVVDTPDGPALLMVRDT
jgi:aminoglycoside 6'-N-acetyltransferase